ncbi:hypothetical protein N8946_01785, partial [Pseudomonadales bacterium]|nr:hypothetical protein [Pseudomonadales bacterium]
MNKRHLSCGQLFVCPAYHLQLSGIQLRNRRERIFFLYSRRGNLRKFGTGINRNDPNTWDNERWPTAVHGGILPGHGIGQCDAQWYIRDVPNVRQSFAAVWDTEELLVSFDGVSLWRPWSFNPEWKTGLGGSWLHIDQHPLGRPGKQCVQGLVNLLPTTPNTGGNVVIPG